MIKKKDIQIGSVFVNKAYNMPMIVKSFSPGQESHLGMITLRFHHFTWTGSLRDFQSEFILHYPRKELSLCLFTSLFTKVV